MLNFAALLRIELQKRKIDTHDRKGRERAMKLLKVSHGTIYHWLSGKHRPRLGEAVEIADRLKIDPERVQAAISCEKTFSESGKAR